MATEIVRRPAPLSGAVLLAQTDALMRLWYADEDADAETLRPLVVAARAAIEDGSAKAVCIAVTQVARPNEIGQIVAELIGSFIPPKDTNLKVFSRMMAEDISAAAPSLQALQLAAVKLRRSCDFIPSIAKVLAAVAEQDGKLKARADLIRTLPAKIVAIERLLGPAAAPKAAAQ